MVSWTAYPFLPTLDSLSGEEKKPATPRRSPLADSSNLLRIAILPILPYILNNVYPPTLHRPLESPFTHALHPLRVLSSVDSPWSGIVQVAEILPPTPAQVQTGNVTELHSMRYLRAGHSLLGGVWIGDRVFRMDASGPLGQDKHSTAIGDSIYGAFVTQEAARFAQRAKPTKQQTALTMYAPISSLPPPFID